MWTWSHWIQKRGKPLAALAHPIRTLLLFCLEVFTWQQHQLPCQLSMALQAAFHNAKCEKQSNRKARAWLAGVGGGRVTATALVTYRSRPHLFSRNKVKVRFSEVEWQLICTPGRTARGWPGWEVARTRSGRKRIGKTYKPDKGTRVLESDYVFGLKELEQAH